MNPPYDDGAQAKPHAPEAKVAFFDHGTTVKHNVERSPGANVIGTRGRKVDGAQKATGKTMYTDDIQLPRMLHCKIKRSTRAHAEIVALDTRAALALDGVHAVVTGHDMPEKYGVIPWTRDEQALCTDKVRFIGDGICAVAAESEEIANLALRKIKVTYKDLLPVRDCDTAAVTGDGPESKVNERAKKGNITKRVELAFGDVDENMRDADVVVDDVFQFHGTTHTAIEPHCAIGDYDAARSFLTVYSSTQVPHYLHRDLAEVLKLGHHQVRVVQPAVGGAFGGKSEPFDLEFVVGKLSMMTGRPVKCLYTREEVFYAHRGRHPMRMHFQSAAKKDGTVTAVKSHIDIDGGAYASFGLITAYYAGQLLAGPVGMQSYAFTSTRYYTNKPACGPKRGHGSVQPRFAYEIHLDMLAEKVGMDPMALRKKNFVGEGKKTVNGMQLGSSGLAECLDACAAASGWKDRYQKLPYGRGLGVATSMYISGTNYPIYPNDMPQSAVQITLDRSGRVRVFCGASDIGQGSDSVLATICAEELGVGIDDVRVQSGDTDLCPVDLGAYSSRVTLMMGHAAQEAARTLRGKIQHAVLAHFKSEGMSEGGSEARAAEKLAPDASPNDIHLADGHVFYAKDTSLNLTTREAFWIAEAHYGTLGATGGYRTHPRGGDYRGGTIGASPAYSCTAHVADVEVDPETGRVHVHKIWVAHDCGRALNPVLVEGQMEGSTYMGFAEVALEEMLYGEDVKPDTPVRQGQLVGPSLLDYRIPTTLDTPAIEALIVERPDKNGPYGAKEAGEGPLHSTLPAVANAIYDAVGVRLRELPFTPKKVRDAIAASAGALDQKGGR